MQFIKKKTGTLLIENYCNFVEKTGLALAVTFNMFYKSFYFDKANNFP
jgi:hypothetical protein